MDVSHRVSGNNLTVCPGLFLQKKQKKESDWPTALFKTCTQQLVFFCSINSHVSKISTKSMSSSIKKKNLLNCSKKPTGSCTGKSQPLFFPVKQYIHKVGEGLVKEWKVCVYLRGKHVSKPVNCAAEWLHKPSVFLFLSPSPISNKKPLAGNHLVCLFLGAVGSLWWELRECDLPEMETETSR